MKYIYKIIYIVTFILLSLLQQNIAFSALESTSIQSIHGNAPIFSKTFFAGSYVELRKARGALNKTIAEVGDTIFVELSVADIDGDQGLLENYYGFFGRKDLQGKDADTYFILTDSSGYQTKISPSELSENDIEDWGMEDDEGYVVRVQLRYVLQPKDVGGQIGLNTAPITSYGLPNIGEISAGDNIFDLPGIDVWPSSLPNVWPIRPNNKFQVGIWKTDDITGAGSEQKPPIGVKPYSHKDNTEFLSLGESYTALIWYDDNGNGIYDTDELVFSKLHATPLKYKWSLQQGNSAANGTVPATEIIELVSDTNNTIVLPATNKEALDKWPEAVAKGLPTTEAGIQGFVLFIDVE